MRAHHGAVFAIALVSIASLTAQQARRPASLVVIGGTVITENSTRQLLSPGAVAIEGSNILDVGSPESIASRYSAAATIDARDQVVLPGLINTHTHAAMVMFRGLADDLALMDLSLIHISEPTRLLSISYAVFCLKKKKNKKKKKCQK